MTIDVSWPLLCTRQAKWAETPAETVHKWADSRGETVQNTCNDVVDRPLDDHFIKLNTRTREMFRVACSRIVAAEWSYFPNAARVWNSLPDNVASAGRLDRFKSTPAVISLKGLANKNLVTVDRFHDGDATLYLRFVDRYLMRVPPKRNKIS